VASTGSYRPILGLVNICDKMFTATADEQSHAMLHELMHALVRGRQDEAAPSS
jgi:hypothetical protein